MLYQIQYAGIYFLQGVIRNTADLDLLGPDFKEAYSQRSDLFE